MSKHPLVNPEELVNEARLKQIARELWAYRRRKRGWRDGRISQDELDLCVATARAALTELNISAIIPYTAGPCHRGFDKHPYDKCPDLEAEGCPYITLPGCFFQHGAVLIRKPTSRDKDRRLKPGSGENA